MEVKIEVGESDIVFIKPGQKTTIEIDALPDMPLAGTVIDNGRDAIVKNAGTDNEVTTFQVWVSIAAPPPEALSGMSARVDIETETKENVVAVPIQSVTVRPPGEPAKAERVGSGEMPSAQGPGAPAPPAGPRGKDRLEKVVFVYKDGKVAKRKVTTGLQSDTMIEIVEGLEPGEQVVEGPYRVLARQIQDGDQVQPASEGGGPMGRGRRGGGGPK
jgi:HlyD family secretion protein